MEECKLDVRVVPDLMSGIKIMGVIYQARSADSDRDDPETGLNSGSQRSILEKYGTQMDADTGSRNSRANSQANNSLDGKLAQRVIYQILFSRKDSKIIGVSESCLKHFGLKSRFFNFHLDRNKQDSSIVKLLDLCPEFVAQIFQM